MSDYHFEDENDLSGETIRLDDVSEQVKKIKKDAADADGFGQTLTDLADISGIERAVQDVKASLQIEQEMEEKKKAVKPRPDTPKGSGAAKKPEPPRRKRNPALAVAVVCTAGVLTFAACFFLFFTGNSATPPTELDKPPAEGEIPTPEPAASVYMTALIEAVSASRELEVYHIEEKRYLTLAANNDTLIQNEKGETVSFSSLKPGELVQIATDEDQLLATSIAADPKAWTEKGVTGVQAAESGTVLKAGARSYSYGEETVFLYNDKRIEAEALSEIDVVTLRGYGSHLYSVHVESYHGYLIVKNSEEITDATITIDDEEPLPLTLGEEIPVSEGSHKIVITGSNIETYRADIYITADEKFEINTQTKTGVLVIKANITDYKLFVNGAQIAAPQEPLVLDMGEYTIRIEKDGYEPFEEKIAIREPSAELVAELAEKVRIGALVITTEPEGAYVYIDSVYVGVSPLETQVTYGEHRILVKKDGYLDIDSPITLNKERQAYSVVLTQ